MQQLSTRERTLLRVGVTVAILITLWLLGFLGQTAPVVS
jgi:hypothetical protein